MENKKVSMSDVIAFTIAILIIFTTMFNNEIRNLLLSDWKTVMFFIGILLLIYSVLSFSMRIICRNIIKSQFNDIVSLNKRVIETEDYRNNTLLINSAFIREILNTYNNEQLYEIGIKMWENQGVGIDNPKKIKTFPNLKDWGFNEKIIRKILAHYHELEKNKLTE